MKNTLSSENTSSFPKKCLDIAVLAWVLSLSQCSRPSQPPDSHQQEIPQEAEKHWFANIHQWAPLLSQEEYADIQKANILEQSQKAYTTPYLESHANKVHRIRTVADYEKFHLRHITPINTDFVRSGLGQTEAEAQGEEKHAKEDMSNHFNYAYIHRLAYDWLLGLKDSLNSFWSPGKEICFQVNGLSRSTGAQRNAWDNATSSLSPHEVGIAIDIKKDTFFVRSNSSMPWTPIEDQEISDFYQKLLTSYIRKAQNNGKVFAKSEHDGNIFHVVVKVFGSMVAHKPDPSRVLINHSFHSDPKPKKKVVIHRHQHR